MKRRCVFRLVGENSDPIPFTAEKILIGREIEQAIDDDPVEGAAFLNIDPKWATVSRRHAEVTFENDRYVLRNLGKYQTFVNGEDVKGDVVLNDGDVLQFARKGPQYTVSVPAAAKPAEKGPGGSRVFCPKCRRPVESARLEDHLARKCDGLLASRPKVPKRAPEEPVLLDFAGIESKKKRFHLLVDLSGKAGADKSALTLFVNGLLDAMEGAVREPKPAFNVLAFGLSGPESVAWWRTPAGSFHAADEASRAQAKAWLRGLLASPRSERGSVEDAFRRAFEAKEAEAVILLTDRPAAENLAAGVSRLKGERTVEVHALAAGEAYAEGASARKALQKLAAQNSGKSAFLRIDQ